MTLMFAYGFYARLFAERLPGQK